MQPLQVGETRLKAIRKRQRTYMQGLRVHAMQMTITTNMCVCHCITQSLFLNQVYNENVRDLPKPDGKRLSLKDSSEGGTHIVGVAHSLVHKHISAACIVVNLV